MFKSGWSNKKHSRSSMTWHRLHLHKGWIGVYKNRSSGRGRGRGCRILLTGSTGWPLQSMRGHSPKPLWTYFRCCVRQSQELEKLIERINVSNSFNHRCQLWTDEVIMTSQKKSEMRAQHEKPLIKICFIDVKFISYCTMACNQPTIDSNPWDVIIYRACIKPYKSAADRDNSSVSASVGAVIIYKKQKWRH